MLQVEVKARTKSVAEKSAMPLQRMDKTTLDNIGAESLAGAAQYFSGVQLKDYGGIGGLKTISVRSLGANHTGVSYDGIMLNDAQNGQIDLGKISLDNIGQISLYNAQPTDILQPARAFSYASVLALKTVRPVFLDSEKVRLDVALKAGSFGEIYPAATVHYQWNTKLYSSLDAGWQKANGEYSFTYKNGSVSQKGSRTNADIDALHAAYNMQYTASEHNILNVNLYYYHSQRGLPGAIILNGGQGTQRYWDDNFFAQASWKKGLSKKSELLVSGKYNYAYNRYLDTSVYYPDGKDEDIFRQNEWYVSGAYSYRPAAAISLSYSGDLFYNTFAGRDSAFIRQIGHPSRYTVLNNLSAILLLDRLEIDANVLSSTIENLSDRSYKIANDQAFTPCVSLIYHPVENIPVRIRAFYKNIFRMPTFNDLYYSEVPNTTLKPEYARQYNLGITWAQTFSSFLQGVYLTADGYYNHVTDMIVARPGTNIGRWSMNNDALVDVKGVDIDTKFSFRPLGKLSYLLSANYTFQQALNMDKRYGQTYKNQIPYTPRDFGSFNLLATYRSFSFSYNAVFSGYRYALDQNLSSNLLQAWNTQDILLGYKVHKGKHSSWKIALELNNLLNTQYQVVWYYPMPGRNFKISLYCNI